MLSNCRNSQYIIQGNISVGKYCIIGEHYGETPVQITGPGTFRSHTVIYMGSVIQPNCMTGHHVLIRHDCLIGQNVSIGSSSVLEHSVQIGNKVRIHSQAFIPEYTIIEDGVWIGPRVTCTNAKYPNSPLAQSFLKGPLIKQGAIIGANVTLLPNVTIGTYAIIGAGSVVTKDVPTGEVWAGAPAKKINERENLPYEGSLKNENS